MRHSPIQLGISRPDAPIRDLAERALQLVDGLLDLIARRTPSADPVSRDRFRETLLGHRERLSAVEEAEALSRVGRECLATCEALLQHASNAFLERENELLDVIRLLREALDALSGGSDEFHSRLTATTEHLSHLAQLDDIRELKKQILQEVEAIKQTVAERRQVETAHYSQLNERVQSLEANLVRAQRQAALDPLTSVANRGTFDSTLEQWIERHRTEGATFVLALADIDDFKRINDAHGHVVGDRVIVCLAQIFSRALRATDFVARYGGEEFALLMSRIPMERARGRMNVIRGQIAPTYRYEHEGRSVELSFTFSAGLAESDGQESATDLVHRADQALYQAKRSGKDRIVVYRRSYLGSLLKRASKRAGAA